MNFKVADSITRLAEGTAFIRQGRFPQTPRGRQAREYLTKALEIFERLGTLIEPDKVRKELDDLSATA